MGMTKRKLHLLGGVKVSVRGDQVERFLNIAAQREQEILMVERESDGEIVFWTTPGTFKRMKSTARKAGVHLRIKKRAGIPFFLYRNRKRKLLACGLISFFLFLYGMTFFVWDISFDGNERFTDEVLLRYIETIPVVHGMRKSKISCEEIEDGLRDQFSELTWVSAEIKGTRLMIHVKENEALTEPLTANTEPCDLAAAKQGEIVKVVVRSGICLVRAGDVVEAGTLLVDGTIPIYDDSEVLINSHEVHADAEIYARTVYQVEYVVPWTKKVRSRTGAAKSGIIVGFFDKICYLMMPLTKDVPWEFVVEQKQLKLLEHFYLPIYYGTLHAFEYSEYEEIYTEEEILGIRDAYLREYMENLMEKGIQIIGNDGKIEKGESGWQIQGTLTVIEDIATEIPVLEPEEQEEI